MKPVRILLAENYPEALTSCAELLQRAGHQVWMAESVEAARRLLDTTYFHVAIFDLRRRDDNDSTDKSRLELARACDATIRKIIFTQFQDVENVREALLDRGHGP